MRSQQAAEPEFRLFCCVERTCAPAASFRCWQKIIVWPRQTLCYNLTKPSAAAELSDGFSANLEPQSALSWFANGDGALSLSLSLSLSHSPPIHPGYIVSELESALPVGRMLIRGERIFDPMLSGTLAVCAVGICCRQLSSTRHFVDCDPRAKAVHH